MTDEQLKEVYEVARFLCVCMMSMLLICVWFVTFLILNTMIHWHVVMCMSVFTVIELYMLVTVLKRTNV